MELKRLIIRGDDLGYSHTINMGFRKLAERGVVSAWSIMAPCPWFMEAVDLAKDFPEVDLGMHLTLNAEMQGYRYGPVLGASRVPSLVDRNGYFFPTPLSFIDQKPKKEEVEAELRAQIERVLASGLNLRYIDNSHNNNLHVFPEMNEIANRLIEEYKLMVSPFIFDPTQNVLAMAQPTCESKLEAYKAWLALPKDPNTYSFICIHPWLDTSEAKALKLNTEFDIAMLQAFIPHSIGETAALLTDEFKTALNELGYTIVRYRDLPENMQTHSLQLWPREVNLQMMAMVGASPELLAKL